MLETAYWPLGGRRLEDDDMIELELEDELELELERLDSEDSDELDELRELPDGPEAIELEIAELESATPELERGEGVVELENPDSSRELELLRLERLEELACDDSAGRGSLLEEVELGRSC